MPTKIVGSGSFIPGNKIDNSEFAQNPFFADYGNKIQSNSTEVIEKFEQITGIKSRRYVSDNQSNSHIAFLAAERAISDAGTDPETIDQIIVAHNFGDVVNGSHQTNIIPSIASRVKHQLGIRNPNCIPYDIIFGCPGWVQALIQAHMFIESGLNNRCLVIGSEVLSRIVDPFDRDTMIFADGAGAVILERAAEDGILAFSTVSHTSDEVDYLTMGPSYNSFTADKNVYIKMNGRKIYEYALSQVPAAMKACMDKAGVDIRDLKKILIHQANEKMDEAIIKRFYRKYGITEVPENIMPMTIAELGNSSVATIPTLYDLIAKGEMSDHGFESGDILMFASVGAGMNINAVLYRV